MKKITMSVALLYAGLCMAQQPSRTAATILHHFLHPDAHHVLVAAHRGDWHDAPENSMGALKGALKIGADIMETDIRKTKDGVLILMHDAIINRTTSGRGYVSQLTWDYLKTLTLRKENGILTREHIPTFESLMQAVKGKPILVDLDKCFDIIPDVYAIVKKTGTLDQAIFKGSLPLQQLRKSIGSIVDSIHYVPMVHPNDYLQQPDSATYPDNYIPGFFENYTPAGFEVDIDRENSPVLTRALPVIRKKKVGIWTNSLGAPWCAGHDDELSLQDPDAGWGWLIRQGANVIQTDQPVQLLEYLQKNKLHD